MSVVNENNINENKSLLMYTFIPKNELNKEIEVIINEVKKKVSKPDSKLIEQMKQDKEFFSQKKFIPSKKALERLSQLINAIKFKIPIMEEGPTGTSKTFTTLIAIDYLNYLKKKENPDNDDEIKELLRFNLSSQTKSDDLLCQIAGDPNSPAGLKVVDGAFLRAFRDGYPLLLDEFNLASESVLQFILEAISSGILSIIINGKGLQEIHMHKDFCLIATQNPPVGMFSGKRNKFSIDFLSKFSKVKFEIDLEELKEITRGSAKEFNYNDEQVIDEMVNFHEKWVKNYVSNDDVQCFTIRDILATIKSISEKKGNFESINAIYGARYPKEMKKKLHQVLEEFPHLSQKLDDNNPKLDESFPFCYINDSLINAVNQCLFSLENGRNIIISGNKGCGKSFLAKNISKFYNKSHQDKNMSFYKEDNYCICTNKLECSDLIGVQRPSDKIQEGDEMLVWKDGFLTDAIKNGTSIILDNINEAPSTVTERLNGLLDKTYEKKESFFELPENPNEKKILINENFRIICVCEYEKIKKMSPAFINRFDVIVLEDQIEKNISNENLKRLIGVILTEKQNFVPDQQEEVNLSEHSDIGEKLSQSDENEFSSNSPVESDNEGDNKSNDGRNSIGSSENLKIEKEEEDSKKSENSGSKKNLYTHLSSTNLDTESKNSFGRSSNFIIKLNSDKMDQKDINLELNKLTEEYIQKVENISYIEEIIKSSRKIEDFTIYNIHKFVISIDTLSNLIKRENYKIDDTIIIDFVYDLIFNSEKKIEKLNIHEKIIEFFESKLREEDGNDEKDDKYHFQNSNSLKNFMIFLLASSYINLNLCVIGPPGGGKTTSARAFSRIRGKLLEQDEEPFRMYTFNEGTKPHDFFGSSTLNKGKIKFSYGALGCAIKDGSVFIADEFNLSSIQTMRSILPILEPNYNKKIRIPGIEGPIIMNDRFFFIICQNDSNTLGRNIIPKELDCKLRTIYYPTAENYDDIKEICKNINNDISQNISDKLPEEEAMKCGKYMMELKKLKQRILSPWSLRDIHKLFSRIANIRNKPQKFLKIGTEENILFYTMSSVTKENEDRIIDDIIQLICDIFYENDEKKKESRKLELKKLYYANPTFKIMQNKADKFEIIRVFLLKDYCSILYKEYNLTIYDKQKLKILNTNKEKNEKEIKILNEKKEKYEKNLKGVNDKIEEFQEYNKLPKFLNSLFKMLLSNNNEPLLLSGNTSYKKELAKQFLENASVISFNQEITINQLLGSSSFFSKEDGKRFYLKELCNCLDLNNLPELMKYLNAWILNKDKEEIPEKQKLQEIIDKRKNEILIEKFPFEVPINNLYNRLFNEEEENNQNDNNLLNDMVIEFRPGLILSAILGQRSLILVNLPNAKTVVLERFNELISGKHNLTLNEDIHQTFTTDKKKELSNFINFRIIATCRQGFENRLSEALLSRFTVLSIEQYSFEEQKEILFIKSKNKKKLKEDDIQKLINYSKEFEDKFNLEFPLTKMVKCLDLYEKLYEENSEIKIFFPFFILSYGLLEKRSRSIIDKLLDIEKDVTINVPKECPLKIKDNILKSEFTNLGIYSGDLKYPENSKEIYFSQKMVDLINILHTGLSTKTPVILEGIPEQGKYTAIKYLTDYLNFEIININISKETKVEDLLCQISIDKDENGNIKIKNNETKLLKSLKSHEKNPKSVIVFQNINNASSAVLETLTSIAGPVNTNILLPNGDTCQKGEVHIIFIFNKKNGVSRQKLPSTLIHNSLYYIVETPDDDDIKEIIRTLFNYYHMEDEVENFKRLYFESKNFIEEKTNEISLAISDIRKYILFRTKCPKVEPFIITQFIFVYRFSQLDLIKESQKNLGLINLLFDPELDYQKDLKYLVVKLIQGKKDSEIIAETFNKDLLKEDLVKIINTFNNITINGKYSLIFLICSVLTQRACILQGENCSGKTFLIRFLAKMFGRKLIEYQMNSNVGMSIFTRDSIINENLSTQDKKQLENLIKEVKDIIELDEEYKDLSDLAVPQYKKLIKIMNLKIKELKNENNNNNILDILIKIKKKISLIISPVNQIKYIQSDFIRALKEGEWVLIDGIESAPNQIIEKIISLCGDNPELNIFETGKGIYFSKGNKGNNVERIHDNFHLFITCNPSKESYKKIDQTLFNKCMTFSSPQIDSSEEDAALVLFSKINHNINDENILLNLSARLSRFHNYCTIESKKNPYDFAGRIPITPSYLLFSANIFNYSENDTMENKIYYTMKNYWKSISNEEIEENFKNESLSKFSENPFELKIKKNINDKLYNILLIIKNAQEIIYTNNNKLNFSLIDFIKECLNLKLNQLEIKEVIKHIKDTLNLKGKSESNNIVGYIKQMTIILKILEDINDKFSDIDSKFTNLCFNSQEIEEIEVIKEPILKLKLLKELIINKNTYNQKIHLFVLDKNLNKLLKLVDEYIKLSNAYQFKYLIEYLSEKKKLINILDKIFPFNNKKLTPFSTKLISIICLLNKKKINFSFRIEGGHHNYKFEYDKEQIDKLNPELIIKKNEFYFSEGSKLKCKKIDYQIKIDKNKNFKPTLETSMIFLQMIQHFSNIKNITKNEINKAYETINKNKKNIKLPEEKFILQNLFNDDEKSSKISKIWSIIFNCNSNDTLLNYLYNYLYPIESDLIKKFNESFNEIKKFDINQIIGITNQLISFCDENSILWLDTIGKFNYVKSETNNNLNNVLLDIDRLEKLSLSLNMDLTSYIGRLKEIKAELNKDNADNEKKQKIKNKIDKLKNDLNIYLNNRKYHEYHRIIQRLKTKIINSYEENEYYLDNLEKEVKDLIKYINDSFSKFEEEKNIWPMPKTEKYSIHPEVILFKNLIWYSKIKEVLSEIKNAETGKKKGLISKIQKYSEIKSIIDYLEFKFDETEKNSFGVNDHNFIESHLRNVFLLKLIEENEENITPDYLNFEQHINNLISRIDTNENLYNYISTIANEYSTSSSKFKLVIPQFRPLDLVYLFLSQTSRGPKNDLLLKEYQQISIEKIEKLKENRENDYISLITKIIILLIQEKFCRDDIDIIQDFDYIYNEYILKNKNNDDFYKELGFAMEISKLLSESNNIKINSENKLLNDDLIEFSEVNIKKGYNYFIINNNISSKYPSLLYYFCKFPYFTNLLLSKIKEEKFDPNNFIKSEVMEYEKKIPFWIICLRVLSSFNSIEYGNSNIFNKDELSLHIKSKLRELVKENKNIKIDWLNLVLENIPKDIMKYNYRIYYEFFNNLSSSIVPSDKYVKKIIEDIIREFHLKIIDSVLINNDESSLPIYEDFKIENELKNIILDPSKFILKKIKQVLKDNLLELSQIKEIKNLKIPLEEYINETDILIQELKLEINKENEKAEFEYKEKIKRENELLLENELNDKKNTFKFYREKYEILKSFIDSENMKLKNEEKNNNLKIIFKIKKQDIKELKALKKTLEENKGIFNFSENNYSVSKFKYKYPQEKGKILLICGIFNQNDLPNNNTIYFNSFSKEDIIKMILIRDSDNNPKNIDVNKDMESGNILINKIQFNELLPLEEDEILKKKIKEKLNVLKNPEINIPKVSFNGLNDKDFLNNIIQLKNILIEFSKFIIGIKIEFKNDIYSQFLIEINQLIKEIINNNEATIGAHSCQSINKKIEKLDRNINAIDIKIKEFNNKYQSNHMLKLIALYKVIEEKKILNKSFNLIIPKNHNEIKNFQFNEEGLKNVDLSIPFISFDNQNNNIEFCYKKFEKTIGPICPLICGEYIEIKILNSIKNRTILTKIEDIEKLQKEDSISLSYRNFIKNNDKTIDQVIITNKIQEGEDIIIKLKIPNLYKDEEEIHFYYFNLILKTEEESKSQNILIIPCKFIIKLIPLSILLISQNYNLKSINKNQFILDTNLVFAKEKLVFRFKNYLGLNIEQFQTKIESLEENEVKEPSFNFDKKECKIELIIPDIDENINKENNYFSKIHGMLTIAITEQFKVEIEIKAYIVPFKFDLTIYDYNINKYIHNPIFYFSNDDVKNEDFEINVYLKIENNLIFKESELILNWDKNENIEIICDKNRIILNGNHIISLKIKLLKGFYIKEDKGKKIILKLKEIKFGLGEEASITILIKEGEKISVNSIYELSEKFNILYYEENKKNFYNVNKKNIGQLFDENKKFSKNIIYPFDFYFFEYKIVGYRFSQKSIIINNFIRFTKCTYYHLNKFGELTENKVEDHKNFSDLSFYGKEYISKIYNYWNCVFFIVFEFENKNEKIWIDSIKDMEESIYSKYFDNDIDNSEKIKMINELEEKSKEYEADFDKKKIFFMNFSHLIYLLTMKKINFDAFEDKFIANLEENEKKNL